MARRQMVFGVVAVGALLAGCSSSRAGATPTSSALSPAPPSMSSSLSPSAAAGRDALAAYRGMWDAFVAAGKVSDPESPDVRKYASGQALRLIVNDLYTNRQQEKVIRGELQIDPKVTGLKPTGAPTSVSISDCVNDKKWLVYKASGGLVDDVPGGKHSTTATVQRSAAGWKVSSFILKEAGTC